MAADTRPPRPSSTVVLVRPGPALPEVFLVKRHARASFGSRYAFPGGVLERSDAAVTDSCRGVSPAWANARLKLESGGLVYYSAAIRELFEESGVLLATHELSAAALQVARDALNAGTLGWQEFIADNGLELHCDRLHYFSFWITPVGEPHRYSARFFLARSPATQTASHDGGELTESCWLSARQALAARERIKLPYPTRKTLEQLADFDDVDSMLRWADACGDQGVDCIQPAARAEGAA